MTKIQYEYLGEPMMVDGGYFCLYRHSTAGGYYEKYDVETDSWVNSVDAFDAFHGEGDFVTRRVEDEEAEAVIEERRENYRQYMAKKAKEGS